MKSKVKVEVLKEAIERSLLVLSTHMVSKGIECAFFLHEKGDILEEVEGKNKVSYGILIEQQVPGKTRKIYYRRYDVTHKSLNDAKAIAYQELLDVFTGAFLVTAMQSKDEELLKLSTSKEE
jgi:hypothetical protein